MIYIVINSDNIMIYSTEYLDIAKQWIDAGYTVKKLDLDTAMKLPDLN